MAQIDWQAVAREDRRILTEMPEGGDFVAVPCTRADCPNKEPHLEVVEVVGISVSTRKGDFEAGSHPIYLLDKKISRDDQTSG